jgi:hypothetical protein
MKKGLLIFALAAFLAGEYAFVEFYPLSPQTRIHKFERLPVVRQFKRAELVKTVNAGLERSQDGTVSVLRDGERTSWTSATELLDDFDAGQQTARIMVMNLEQAESITEKLPKIKQRARSGDLFAIMNLYWTGRNHTGQIDANEALTMLKEHPSAMARYYEDMLVEKKYDWNSREGVLLAARASAENWLSPAMTDEMRQSATESSQRMLNQLRIAANNGNEDAVWVLEQLLADGYSITADKSPS